MNLMERVTFLNCSRFIGRWLTLLYLAVVCYITTSIFESSFNFVEWSNMARLAFLISASVFAIFIKEALPTGSGIRDFPLNKENIIVLLRYMKESLYVLAIGIFHTLLILLSLYILFAFMLLEFNIFVYPKLSTTMFFISSMGVLITCASYFSAINMLLIANKNSIKR